MTHSRAPVVATVLLLLPVLYVGSYLSLVNPGDYGFRSEGFSNGPQRNYVDGYRFEGSRGSWTAQIAPTVFWPLERIDRRVRPAAWGPQPAGRI